MKADIIEKIKAFQEFFPKVLLSMFWRSSDYSFKKDTVDSVAK